MNAGDYRNEGLFEGGIRKGAAVSLAIHVLAFVLAFAACRLMPPPKAVPQVCNVSLLTLRGSGSRGGGETAVPGGGGTGPAPSPEPAPELETAKRAAKTESMRESPPIAPAPKALPKPAETRKPKPKAAPVSPQRQMPPMAETPSPTVREVGGEREKMPEGPLPGHGPGPGGENAGPGSDMGPGTGPGAGPGTGGGGDGGPITSTFGSGDGPRFANRVLPKYPMVARELGKEGIVLLRLVIDEKGRLVDVELVKKAGAGFDEEALRAVRSSTFHPAMRNGRPVSCKAQLPIHFVLKSTGE